MVRQARTEEYFAKTPVRTGDFGAWCKRFGHNKEDFRQEKSEEIYVKDCGYHEWLYFYFRK
jgi:hypothetical protein